MTKNESRWEDLVNAGVDQLGHPLQETFASAENNADDTHDFDRGDAWYSTFVETFESIQNWG